MKVQERDLKRESLRERAQERELKRESSRETAQGRELKKKLKRGRSEEEKCLNCPTKDKISKNKMPFSLLKPI